MKRAESMTDRVGIVVVSHSHEVAKGTIDMVRQMVGNEIPMAFSGGNPAGGQQGAGRRQVDRWSLVRKHHGTTPAVRWRGRPCGGGACRRMAGASVRAMIPVTMMRPAGE